MTHKDFEIAAKIEKAIEGAINEMTAEETAPQSKSKSRKWDLIGDGVTVAYCPSCKLMVPAVPVSDLVEFCGICGSQTRDPRPHEKKRTMPVDEFVKTAASPRPWARLSI